MDFIQISLCESKEKHEKMTQESIEIGKLLNYMMLHRGKFGCKSDFE